MQTMEKLLRYLHVILKTVSVPEARLQCLRRAIRQHQASKTSETMKKGLALLKETAEVFMVFFFIFGGIQR